MDPINQLKKLGKKHSEEEQIVESFYVIMKTFGYTLNEVKELPIPTFNYLLKLIDKENKMNEKEMKKARGRKR